MRYLNLLDIPSPDGLIMTLEFGERRDNNLPQNRIGSNIRVNRDYLTLREFIKIVTPCLVGPLILNRISIFIPIEGCLFGRLDKQVEEIACQIFKRVQQKIETELRIGVSRPIESVGQLHGAYQETILALQMTPAGEIRYYKDLQPSLMTTENNHLDLLVNNYLHAVSQGDTELTSQLFSQLLLSLETCGLQNLSQAKSKVMEWLFLAVGQTKKPNVNVLVSLDYAGLLSSETLDELRQKALEKILELTVQLSGIHGRPANDLITQARNYIDVNYAKNISLESVAELIALSPPYFSRLFRSQVGKTFIDYLTDLRMSRACQLLREGVLSIKEVTSAVGYTDPNYFSRIFKRIIGHTPSEHRS
jgi:two-component system response regulator YesN